MNAPVVREFLKVARGELVKYPSQYSVGALLLWGISISLFSANLSNIWLAAPYLLAAHILAVITMYTGFIKNIKGKRTPLAIILGLVILLLTILIDTLSIVSA